MSINTPVFYIFLFNDLNAETYINKLISLNALNALNAHERLGVRLVGLCVR